MTRTAATGAKEALADPMPQNVEAERSILGAVLLDNSSLNTISEKLLPNDFFHDHHRKIYLAMLELQNDEVHVDLITLTSYLQTKKDLENIGGAAYVSQLMDGVPHITNVAH